MLGVSIFLANDKPFTGLDWSHFAAGPGPGAHCAPARLPVKGEASLALRNLYRKGASFMNGHLPLVASSRQNPRLSIDDDDRLKIAQTLLAVPQPSEDESAAEDWLTVQRCLDCEAQFIVTSHSAMQALHLYPSVWLGPVFGVHLVNESLS